MQLIDAFRSEAGELAADERATIDEQYAHFIEAFPAEGWPSMTLDRYALGTEHSRQSYSYALEWGTSALGSIRGGTSLKHVIFKRRKDGEWHIPAGYPDVTAAWEALKHDINALIEMGRAGRWTEVVNLTALQGAVVVTLKTLSLYFPASILPVHSHDHLRHFAGTLGLDSGGDPILLNRRIFTHLKSITEIGDLDGHELAHLLYAWSPPAAQSAKLVVKIAPGHKGDHWQDCLRDGFICVGWDLVGDLTLFDSEEAFRAAFAAAYPSKGNQSHITRKANELWTLTTLRAGDRVVANRGTSEVLGVGTVLESAYEWRDDRPDYQHTVAVSWDTSLARHLEVPVKRWATTTVLRVPNDLAAMLLTPADAPQEPSLVHVQQWPEFAGWARLLERKKQIIFYGPPGTGKTHSAMAFTRWWLTQQLRLDPAEFTTAEELDDRLRSGPPNGSHDSVGHLTMVTFHASYSYEEFLEGYRPVRGTSGLALELRDGVIKKVAAAASANPGKPYVLIIDEINRANVPRVFGELMTVLEADKRGLPVTLPTSGHQLVLPPNVVLIGTMNTADRSIRTLDAALRRRFAFIEVMPRPELLSGAVVNALGLDAFLRELNQRITRLAGRERQVGHSFFMDGDAPVEDLDTLADVLRLEIIPLLQEIAFDDYGRLRDFLGSKLIDVDTARLTSVADDANTLLEALATEYTTEPDDQ